MLKGKRIKASYSKIDKNKAYLLEDAVSLLKKFAPAKFDEAVDVAINLNVNPRRAEQNIRSTVVLPHGTGKTKKIAVVCKGEKEVQAKEAGADFVGSDDLLEKISNGWFDFDILIATPDMMRDLGKLGKLLGPRNLMPNPKSGTVTMDITKAVNEVKSGKVEFRVDSYGIIHSSAGKISFIADNLIGNIQALVDIILKLKPSTVKGIFLKNVTISSTMGPGVKIDTASFFK
ncbi:MAG: 50S ribosomal protein L1 [bacterium]|nr:50S ribosomal protein L1 [bacterium]